MSLPEGREVATADDALTDDVLLATQDDGVHRHRFGIDGSNESTPTVDCLHGLFGAKANPVSPSVDVTPCPFDTTKQPWHLEYAAREEHGNTAAADWINRCTSTKEELEELYAWAQSVDGAP